MNQSSSIWSRLIPITGIAVLFYLIGISWGLPAEFSPAIDAPAPYSPLAFVGQWSRADVAEKYPALHQLVTFFFYAFPLLGFKLAGTWRTVASEWPYGFANPTLVLSTLLLVSNVIAALMGALGVAIVWKISRLYVSSRDALFSVLLIGGSGVYTYYARVPNLDVPYLLWWLVCLLSLAVFLRNPAYSSKLLILAAVSGAAAVATKDQAAGLVIGAAVCVALLGRTPEEPRRAALRRFTAFSGIALAAYVIFAIAPQPVRWMAHMRTWLPSARNIQHFIQFTPDVRGYAGLIAATIRCTANVLSPAGLALGLFGAAILFVRRDWPTLATLLLPAITYFLLIILPIRFVYERFMLAPAASLAICAAIGCSAILSSLQGRGKIAAQVALLGVIAWQIVTGYGSVTYVMANDSKSELDRTIDSFLHGPRAIEYVDSAGGRDTGTLTELPNANTYRRIQLVLATGVPAPQRSANHVFTWSNDPPQFILATSPLGYTAGGARLIHAWTVPEAVRKHIHVPMILHQYYLYER